MAEFEVKVVRVDAVTKHENADTLDVISIGGYRCIANHREDGSSRYAPGDLVVYIPEGAVLPDWFLDAYGWRDKLSGAGKDRVKAVKLRGILSQGILHPVHWQPHLGLGSPHFIDGPMQGGAFTAQIVHEGMNVSDFLGITKYEPPVPESMRGDLKGFRMHGMPLKFDIENVKKYPNILEPFEEVVFTEKIHGTFCQIGYVPGLNDPELFDGEWYVSSKGLGAQGLVFKDTPKNRASNIYVKTLVNLKPKLDALGAWANIQENPIVIMGEVYGAGVQDLAYGTKAPEFRVFRMYHYDGPTNIWHVLDHESMKHVCDFIGFDMVPVLYEGPFSPEVLEEHTNGKTTLIGDINKAHIREGVVITPKMPRYAEGFGDVILKSVSADYLLRKDKNATEFA